LQVANSTTSGSTKNDTGVGNQQAGYMCVLANSEGTLCDNGDRNRKWLVRLKRHISRFLLYIQLGMLTGIIKEYTFHL